MSWPVLEQALTTFVGTGTATALGGWLWKTWITHGLQLEAVQHRSQLAAQVQTGLEHLKRDLSDSLAQRARQAEHLKAQIQNLYGPLAFYLESRTARHGANHGAFVDAFDEWMESHPGAGPQDGGLQRVADAGNRYVPLIAGNDKNAEDLLSKNWAWARPG
jgi:hypothetical protein